MDERALVQGNLDCAKSNLDCAKISTGCIQILPGRLAHIFQLDKHLLPPIVVKSIEKDVRPSLSTLNAFTNVL